MTESEQVLILQQMLADVIKSRNHTQRFYARRIDVLEGLARERGEGGAISTREVWSIIANGTASVNDPPTMAVMLNTAEYRAQRAEAAARELASAVEMMLHDDRVPIPPDYTGLSKGARLCWQLAEAINNGSACIGSAL